jgi:CheY-like chemotaxis protein
VELDARDADKPPSLAGIRVLIVEDDDDNRDILQQVLRHLGATVMSVALVREALGMVPAADIVVTDLSMPGEDGVWLLEKVNAHPHPIRSSWSADMLSSTYHDWRRPPSRASCSSRSILNFCQVSEDMAPTLRRNGLRLRQDASPAPIASGRAGGRRVMTRCTRALQHTNGRHLGTPPNRWRCGRSATP